MTNEILKLMSGTLSCSTNIKSLNLSQNSLKDAGAQQIAEILLSNKYLEKLKIDQNQISE